MWRIAAKLLWAFEFTPYVDPVTGEEFKLDPDAYNAGILQAPLRFKVTIRPRSEEHAATIRREHVEAKDFMVQFE